MSVAKRRRMKPTALTGVLMALLTVFGCDRTPPPAEQKAPSPRTVPPTGQPMPSAEPPYVLPTADGAGATPSSPTIAGRISALGENTLAVSAENGSQPSMFQLTAMTSLFTAFGGDVDVTELMVGQHVRVWMDPNATDGALQRAAVVMLASLDPAEGFNGD